MNIRREKLLRFSNAQKPKTNRDLMVKLQTMHTSNHVWGELEDPNHRKLNLNPAEKEALSRIPRPLSLEGQRDSYKC